MQINAILFEFEDRFKMALHSRKTAVAFRKENTGDSRTGRAGLL